MINIDRKYNHQDILDEEKVKPNGTYRVEPVISSIAEEFFGKCYICEDDGSSSFNIEHFEPHQGDKNKEFDYMNLFWSCQHCNGIKASRTQILNPTKEDVENIFDYSIEIPDSTELESEVTISTSDDRVKSTNTADLLNKVYNGTTHLGKFGARSIQKRIVAIISDLLEDIKMYNKSDVKEEKERIKRIINSKLKKADPFHGFRISIIRKYCAEILTN